MEAPAQYTSGRLSAAIVEAIGDVVEQWSLDVIGYNDAANNDESKENS